MDAVDSINTATAKSEKGGFLVDRCAPKTVNDVFFHKEIYERLKVMSRDSIPHIIFHGEPGSGKKTMVNIFLDMIYKGESRITSSNKYKIPGSGSKIKEEIIEGSRHHIVIKPTGTNFDRYLVHNVVKSYAGSRSIESKSASNNSSKFRVILISNLDKLSHSAQNSLRRMIEVNSNNCRFIMWANNLSNVIGPLKSRGFCVRVPRPSDSELFGYLSIVAVKEGRLDIPLNTMRSIVEYSENDIRKALWCLESIMLGYPYKTQYDDSIKNIVDLICKCEVKYVDDYVEQKSGYGSYYTNSADEKESGIRDRLFNLMITNYNTADILKSIMTELIQRDDITEQSKMSIIMQTSKTEYDMTRARREIIHFDAYVSAVMNIIHSQKSSKSQTKTVRQNRPHSNGHP